MLAVWLGLAVRERAKAICAAVSCLICVARSLLSARNNPYMTSKTARTSSGLYLPLAIKSASEEATSVFICSAEKYALVAECLSFEGKTKSVVLFCTCDVIFCVAGYSRGSKSQEMKRPVIK